MGIEIYNIPCGKLPRGQHNLITDVKGVKVGHCTIHEGNNHTGVTVILPSEGVTERSSNVFKDKLVGAAYVHNGFGKTLGTVQIQELGTLETPIALTNTLNVGLVHDALVGYTLEKCAADGTSCRSVNAVVGECNDSSLNDIGHRVVTAEHVKAAVQSASIDFEEGCVGAGTSTLCYGFKGGIGSASRVIEIGGKQYTIGVLVQSNFGSTKDFVVNGRTVGEEVINLLEEGKRPQAENGRLPANGHFVPAQVDKGSIMTVIATDLPVTSRQLERIARRAGAGLARTGSFIGHGSGEIMLAFSTANVIRGEEPFMDVKSVREDLLDLAFRAVAEATNEAVLSSMLHAKTAYGLDGRVWYSLADFELFEKK